MLANIFDPSFFPAWKHEMRITHRHALLYNIVYNMRDSRSWQHAKSFWSLTPGEVQIIKR